MVNEATHVNYGEYVDIYYNENKKLLEEGVRLDSIGFQFHFFNGNHIAGAQSGVATANDIEISQQGAVLNFSVVTELGAEIIISSEMFQGNSGGNQFEVGGRDEQFVALDIHEIACLWTLDADADDGTFKRRVL